MNKTTMKHLSCRVLLSVGIGLLCLPAVRASGIHRWVDADGVVHFGDRPPPGVRAETLEQPSRSAASATKQGTRPLDEAARRERRRRLLRAFEEERRERALREAEAARRAEQRRRACLQARDNLRSVRQASGLYRLNERGERVFLDREARARAEARAEAEVARYCAD